MKNYEKYADEIRKYKGDNFCIDFVLPNIMESNDCDGNCDVCRIVQMIWFMEECKEPEEPETDWSKVEGDTPILVRNDEVDNWTKRYFARYENGIIYAWVHGRTSWTAYDNLDVSGWKHAKLAEGEEECKELEVDWSKVKVDTPILVRGSEDGDWLRRHFAKYEDGIVYTWKDGHTSWTVSHDKEVTGWNFSKLAESEEE